MDERVAANYCIKDGGHCSHYSLLTVQKQSQNVPAILHFCMDSSDWGYTQCQTLTHTPTGCDREQFFTAVLLP